MKPMYFILSLLVLYSIAAALLGRSTTPIVVGNLFLACVPCFLMVKTLKFQRG